MNNALYFPFISVPESPWFTRVLLYWDRVGAIIPFEFVEEPQRLSDYTRELLTEELLTQIIPGQYVWQAPRFVEAFVNYVESIPGGDISRRRMAFLNRGTSRIHTEKMQDIADYLVDFKLAKRVGWTWCDVESTTGGEFMGYLAALLGKIEAVESVPVTDHPANFEPFMRASQPTDRVEARIAPLRTIVLDKLLLVPEEPVPVSKLRIFKERHGNSLRHFRHAIEQEISSMADMTDPYLQNHRLKNFIAEKRDEVEEISAYFSEGGLGRATFSKVSALVSAIPGVHHPLIGLASAVYSAFSGGTGKPRDGAFLYAAYVQKELS